MKRTSLPRPAAPLALAAGLALGLAPTSLAHHAGISQSAASRKQRADVETAKEIILSVVNPQPASSPQETPLPRGARQDNLPGAISSLMASGEADAIFQIDVGAAPALRALADRASLRDLVLAHESTSPLLYLAVIDPMGAVAYYETLLDQDVERFQALAFIEKGGLLDAANHLVGKDRGGDANGLFARACADERLDEGFRVRLALDGLMLGISAPETEQLLLANLDAWQKASGLTEPLARLYLKRKGLPTKDIAPHLAAILWGHSLEVDTILAQNVDPTVRAELARMMSAAMYRNNNGFKPHVLERLPLLVEQALRETGAQRRTFFDAVEHILKPVDTIPELPFDLLCRVLAGSESEASLSSELASGLSYQLSHGLNRTEPLTEEQWARLFRIIAACSKPQLKQKYLARIDDSLRLRAGKLAYARVLLEGGKLPREVFLNYLSSYRETYLDDRDVAATRLRLAQMFADQKDVLKALVKTDGAFRHIDPAQMGEAAAIYAAAGPRFHRWAAEDASRWGRQHSTRLAELCSARDLSWGARAVAALGLLESNDPKDGALAAEVLIEQGKDQVKVVASLINSRPDSATDGQAWTEFVARLLTRVAQRPELLSALPYNPSLYSTTPEQRASMIASATSMARMDAASIKLTGMSEVLTSWMVKDPALRDDALILPLLRLRPWIQGSTDLPSLALSRPLIREEAMGFLLKSIRGGERAERIVTSALQGAKDHELDALVQAVTESPNGAALERFETRLATLSRVKAAQQQWSSASAKAPTKQAAVGQVLALLESDDEDVRVEAILGLSTLGAVEALPTLIGLVGSGSAREKTAAKESLSLLREVARNQARQNPDRQNPSRQNPGLETSGAPIPDPTAGAQK